MSICRTLMGTQKMNELTCVWEGRRYTTALGLLLYPHRGMSDLKRIIHFATCGFYDICKVSFGPAVWERPVV
jgi:hypothetical protein